MKEDEGWVYFETREERRANAPFRPGLDQWFHPDLRRWVSDPSDSAYMPEMLGVRRPKQTEDMHFL